MSRKLSLIILLQVVAASLYSQNGCSGCALNLPDRLSSDTIFLTPAPDGQAGIFYEGDLSFRLPKTTTPVAAEDPDVPSGLSISKITISSVSNLPPGLNWEPSKREFRPANETDGCVRFCGIPLQAGVYEVDVLITARLVVVDRTASIKVPMVIKPAERITDGFNIRNNTGCGVVEAGFKNNVPSKGKAGFSYSWDFGNGAISEEERPANQRYDLPGTYPVYYQALIDTTGYFLTNVTVQAVSCGDLFGGKPDLKVNVIDPSGELIYISDITENANTPLNFELSLQLGPGNYQIAVVDNDYGLGGGDDLCGKVNFTRDTSGFFTEGGLKMTMEILHPVDTITSVDTVFVYDQPDPPQIKQDFMPPLCYGDTMALITNYNERIQWYQDSVPVLNGRHDTLLITSGGDYWVNYTSLDGCASIAEPVMVRFGNNPIGVVFTVENNELKLYQSDVLPDSFSIRWFQDEVLLEDFTDTSYCIGADGTYTIELIDASNGCSAIYYRTVSYDPNFPNCVSPVANVLPAGIDAVQLFPNPSEGMLNWNILADRAMEVQASLYTLDGRQLRLENWRLMPGMESRVWNLEEFPAGMYMVRLTVDGQGKSWQWVKY